jgi:hypothetical protein
MASTTRKQPVRPSGFAAENVPVEIKTGIGELIVQWSYVAFQLGVVVRVGFGLRPDVGFALLSTVDLQPLCGALRTLASGPWVPDGPLKAEIEKLATDVQKKKDRRNDFAHGVYGMVEAKDGSPLFVRFRFRDGIKGKLPYEPVTLVLLRELADEAYDFGRRAQDLTVALKVFRKKAGTS